MSSDKFSSTERWRFTPADRVIRLAMSKQTNWLILADQARNLYVLDENGKPQWQTQLDFPIHDLGASEKGGLFICLLQDGSLIAFGRIGAERWRFQFDREAICFDLGLSGRWIAVGMRNQNCMLLSPASQTEKKIKIDHRIGSVALLEALENDIVVASEVGDITYIKPDGQVVWSHRVRSHTGRIGVSANGKYIIIPAYEEGIHTFFRSGEGAGAYDLGQPVILTDINHTGEIMAACTEQNRVHIIDRDANILWFNDFSGTVSNIALNASADFLTLVLNSKEVIGIALRSSRKKFKEPPSSLEIGGVKLEAITHKKSTVNDTAAEPTPVAEEKPAILVPQKGRETPSEVLTTAIEDSETKDDEEDEQVVELSEDEVVVINEETGEQEVAAQPVKQTKADAPKEPAETEAQRIAFIQEGKRRVIWKLKLEGEKKPPRETALLVSRKGTFASMVTASGRFLVFNRSGLKMGEIELDDPAAGIMPHRLEKFALVWTKQELIELDINTGKARRIEFGHMTPIDAACSGDLQHFAVIHDENRLSLVSMQGKVLWRKKPQRPLKRVLVSPKGAFILVEDDENRFLVYNSDGKLVRKHRFESTQAFEHVVLEEAYAAFANRLGRTIVLDRKGKQIWNKRLCRRLQKITALGDHLGVIDKTGPCFVFDLYGNSVARFGTRGGIRVLCKPKGKAPTLFHAEDEVITAFVPPSSKVLWRYHCEKTVRALAVDRNGEMIVAVAGNIVYCLNGSRVL